MFIKAFQFKHLKIKKGGWKMWAVKSGRATWFVAKNANAVKNLLKKDCNYKVADYGDQIYVFNNDYVISILKPHPLKTTMISLSNQIPLSILKETVKVKNWENWQVKLFNKLKEDFLNKREKAFKFLKNPIPQFSLNEGKIMITGKQGTGKTSVIVKFFLTLHQKRIISSENIRYVSFYRLSSNIIEELNELMEIQKEGNGKIDIFVLDDFNIEKFLISPKLASDLVFYFHEIDAKIKIIISNTPMQIVERVWKEKKLEPWILSRLQSFPELNFYQIRNIEDKRKADKI